MSATFTNNRCGGNIIVDEHRGEIICASTGEVLGQLVDLGPEWRDFQDSSGPSRSRVGSPITNLFHDHGIGTTISNRDIRTLDAQRRRNSYRIKRLNAVARIKGREREIKARQMLRIEGIKLGLPTSTIETASGYIKKVINNRLGRGERIRAYIAAALFIAARVTRVPRSFADIINQLEVDEESARDAYRKIIELMGGKVRADVYTPVDYVPLLATKLGLSIGTEKLMYRLSKAVYKLNLVHGKSPYAVAAAIAYIASSINGEKRNQREIAEAAGSFTDVAIRNRYREIVDNLYIQVSL